MNYEHPTLGEGFSLPEILTTSSQKQSSETHRVVELSLVAVGATTDSVSTRCTLHRCLLGIHRHFLRRLRIRYLAIRCFPPEDDSPNLHPDSMVAAVAGVDTELLSMQIHIAVCRRKPLRLLTHWAPVILHGCLRNELTSAPSQTQNSTNYRRLSFRLLTFWHESLQACHSCFLRFHLFQSSPLSLWLNLCPFPERCF